MRCIPAIAALVALLLAAPLAIAQSGAPVPSPSPAPSSPSSPFAPLPPARTVPAPPPTVPSRTPTNSHPNDQQLSTARAVGPFPAGGLVIVLIGYFIMRDARRSTRKQRRRAKATGSPSPATARSGRGAAPRPPSGAAPPSR